MKNLGAAPAQAIKFHWRVSGVDDAVTALQSSVLMQPFSPRRQDHLIYISNNGSSWGGSSLSQDVNEIPYCGSSANSDGRDRVEMPPAIEGHFVFLLAAARGKSHDQFIGPDIRLAVQYVDLLGNAHSRNFLIGSTTRCLPDNVGSDINPISREHFHPANLRGSVRFTVTPVRIG